MPASILNFLLFMGTAGALLLVFVLIYVRLTPYREFEHIERGEAASAISLGGAILGFSLPLTSSIYFTHSLLEMAQWAVVTMLVQLLVFAVIRRLVARDIERNNVAQAIFLAAVSISIGMINAVSISD